VYLGDQTERSYPARPAEEIRGELGEALTSIAEGRFVATPGPQCRYCDFKRDCAEGRAFLAANEA
jgi:hypothetical protein